MSPPAISYALKLAAFALRQGPSSRFACCRCRHWAWRQEADRCVWVQCKHCGATSPAKHSYRLAWERFKSVGFEGRGPGRVARYTRTSSRDDRRCARA